MPENPAAISEITGRPASDKAVVQLADYSGTPGLLSADPIIAIGAGPYLVRFQSCVCGACGEENLIRQYSVKTLALVSRSDGLTDDEKRAQVAAMDNIGLAAEIINSPLWLVPNEQESFIGLVSFYRSFPPWVIASNLRLANQLRQEVADGNMPAVTVAPFASNLDSSGRRCLHLVCRHCRSNLTPFDNRKASIFPSTLTNVQGNEAMEPWLMVVGGLA